MDEEQVKQGSQEWKDSRKGYITSSAIYRLMTKPKLKADIEAGNLSEGAKAYVLEVIASKVSVPFELKTEPTSWGKAAEDMARYHYHLKTGNVVSECEFIQSDIPGYGGSPDGRIKVGNGIIEIKAPYDPAHHLEHCLIESIDDIHKEEYWQMVSNMRVCNADWCDFVSFDPRIDSDLGLFIFRLYREKEKANEEKMMLKIEKALEYKEQIEKRLKIK